MNHYPRRPLTDDKSRCNDLDEQSPTATKPPGVNQAASATATSDERQATVNS